MATFSANKSRPRPERAPRSRLRHNHIVAKLCEAVDTVRRQELATGPELKDTRWLWLKNWANLSTAQRRELQRLHAALRSGS